MQGNNLLSIQEVSERLKVPKHTLRFWEKELSGIIVPLRTNGRQRRYGLEVVSLIEHVKRQRGMGRSLAEIRSGLSTIKSNKNSIDLLAERVAEVVKSEVYRFLETGELANNYGKYHGNECESYGQMSNRQVTPRIVSFSTKQPDVAPLLKKNAARHEDCSDGSSSGEQNISETAIKTSNEET